MDDSEAVQDLLLAARFSHLEREVVKGLPVPGRIETLARGLREIRSSVRTIANRLSALLWGALAGSITQSMPALTFIVVSILRSGMIDVGGCYRRREMVGDRSV